MTLTLVEPEVREGRKSLYLCDCGTEKMVLRHNVKSGGSASCGCRERGIGNFKHGGKGTPEYISWKNMRSRCLNPNHSRYDDWGGRGIRVCERWDDFTLFLRDMGAKPTGCTLDREDNNKDYTPENCKWSTITEQNNNQRRRKDAVLLTDNGVTQTLPEWARDTGQKPGTLYQRRRLGWTDGEVIHGR